MANRVDDTTAPQTTNRSDEIADTDEVGDGSETTAGETTQATTPGDKDIWETASNPYGNYLDIPSAAESTDHATDSADIDPDDAMAVWEMVAGSESSESTAGDGFDLGDNRAARALAGASDEIVGNDLAGPIGTELNIQVFDDMSASGRQDLIELGGHTDELHAALVERHGDVDLADDIVDEVESRVVGIAGERIADRARPQIEESIQGLEQLDDSSDTRRAFLASVASGAENEQQITDTLTEFGLTSSAADDIATVLDDLRTDDEAMATFVDGDDGDRDILRGEFRGEFDRIDRELSSELGSMLDGLESLERSLDRNQIQNDRFLTDPNIAHVRDEVLEEMGAVTGPPEEVNGLGELFNEATGDSEVAERNERWMRGAINVATTLAVGAATGGLGGAAAVATGAATSGAQAAPDIADAGQTTNQAQAAAHGDFATPDLVEKAEDDEALTYAMSFGGVVAGANSLSALESGIEGADAIRESR